MIKYFAYKVRLFKLLKKMRYLVCIYHTTKYSDTYHIFIKLNFKLCYKHYSIFETDSINSQWAVKYSFFNWARMVR